MPHEGRYQSLARGSAWCAGAVDAGIYCWAHQQTPALLPGSEGLRDVVSGGHLCALDARGGAHCWGGNFAGQLGRGFHGGGNDHGVAPVVGGLWFAELEASQHVTCGRTFDDELFCWGLANNGILGTYDGVIACIEGQGVVTECASAPARVEEPR